MMSLHKPLSEPETAIVNSTNEVKESAEHWNFQMASNLQDGKAQLIKVLCQFPATALWLFHKYETDNDKPEQSAEAMSVALAKIKHHYLLASLSFSGRGFNREAETDEKQHLTEALQAFPFSTEDLLVLTEFIIYAFTTRDDCDQSANRSAKSRSDWIAKRLEGSSRRYKLNLPDIIETMCSSQFDQQFLFLSGTDMQQYVTDMIFA